MNTNIYTYLDKPINIIEASDTVWFMAKDIFELLDLAWRGADSLWQRQIPKEDTLYESFKTKGGNQKTWFINTQAITQIILKGTKQPQKALDFARYLGISIENVFLRRENAFLGILQSILDGWNTDERIEIKLQYQIEKYRVDGYISHFNMVIEYDEKQHNYHKISDYERELGLLSQLSIYRPNIIILPILFRINIGEELDAIKRFTAFLLNNDVRIIQPDYFEVVFDKNGNLKTNNFTKSDRYEYISKYLIQILNHKISNVVELQYNKKIEAQIQTTNNDYYSLAGYYALRKKQWNIDKTEAQKTGTMLKKLSVQLNFTVIKVYDANYGEVNGYHKDVLAKGLGF